MPVAVGHGPGVAHVAGLLAPLLLGTNPATAVPSNTALYSTHQDAIYNFECLKSQVRPSVFAATIVAPQKLGTYVTTQPQVDTTLPSTRTPLAAVANAPFFRSEYLYGTHEAVIYNFEALKSRHSNSAIASIAPVGILGRWYTTDPQIQWPQDPQNNSSIIAPFVPTGLLGQYIYSPPQ